jgi:UDP-GlcNAc:undecaprenyl-phosphate GlcNAc-1-phosphate transferase
VSGIFQFVALVALSAVLVAVMVRVGTLDHPVERSSHSVPTPKGGGVGIVAAVVIGMLCLRGTMPWLGDAPVGLALAALGLGGFSYLDDIYDWPFVAKLMAQLVAALVFMSAGGIVHTLEFTQFPPGRTVTLDLGLAGPVLTLGWLLFVTNAVNFMDGLNGLASGSVALVGLLYVISPGTRSLGLPLVAGIAGFLPFNYPKARIFMGDVGSQPIGFTIAAVVVLVSRQPWGLLDDLPILLALLPMLADVLFTLARRARSLAPLTQAHRSHLYQVAQRSGMAAWRVTLIYWGMAAMFGLMGALSCPGAFFIWFLPGAQAFAVALPVIATAMALIIFVWWGRYVARRAARAGLTVW